MISSSIINGTSISVPNLNQYVAQGDIFARVFGYNEEAPETNYFSSGLSSESTSSLSYSEPEYLQFKIISRSGFLFYNWEIEIINPKTIITLGNQVSSIILNRTISVSQCRKQNFLKNIAGREYRVYPVYYPIGNGMMNIDKAIEDLNFIIKTNTKRKKDINDLK